MPNRNRLLERFHHQHVTGTPLGAPEDVVSLLGAVQSQDYSGAKWALGMRASGSTDRAIDEAFSAGRFLRTHILRPTWHFVAPADIRWMLRLTAPHVQKLNAYRYRQLGLDPRTLGRASTLIAKTLEGGRQLTRREIGAMLEHAGISTEGQRLAYIAMNAELEGLVCSGALKGRQHTYALLDERVPPAPAVDREEALLELTRRFLAGHAPAMLKHYAWWSGLPAADAKAGLEMARPSLAVELDEDGGEWFGVRRSGRMATGLSAHLVPEYDEALTGSRDLGIPGLPRGAGTKMWKDAMARPIIIGGHWAGTWRRTLTGHSVLLETIHRARLTAPQSKALDDGVKRYERFLGVPVALRRTRA